MFHSIFENNDEKTNAVKNVLDRILSCDDVVHIVEIYAKNHSIIRGSFGNWIGLMVVTDKFPNESLADVLDDIEQEDFSSLGFELPISEEPNDADRGHGTILWKRE